VKTPLTTFQGLLLSVLLGAQHTLTFAPLEWWWLQLLSLGGFYWLLSSTATGRLGYGTLLGFAFGLGWFLTGTSWIYVSLHYYGALPMLLAGFATFLFCAGIALLPAFSALLFARLNRPSAWLTPVLFAACWGLGEWLRGTVFTGFPWIATGSAHTTGLLQGYAPVIGVYGLSLIAALSAALLAEAARHGMHNGQKITPRAIAQLITVLAIFGIGLGLSAHTFTTPHGKPITVRLLQGNVPQEIKFDLQHVRDSFYLYGQLISQQRADLIVTPETALPQLWHEIDPEYLRSLQEFSSRTHSHLILGVPVADSAVRYTNSAMQFSPAAPQTAGKQLARYDKSHLVPFGEFIPFGFRWFVDMMKIPMGDFTRGGKIQPPFAVADQRVALNICYEDLFGEEIIGSLQGDTSATILLNISNIAWFGDSIALPQHLQASQMRAMETGRPMLRATNTGLTAVITPDGKVAAALPSHTRAVLSATVQGHAGLTPYGRWGNAPVLWLVALILLLALLTQRRFQS
jgi:apolipoprotein N-acyltransferase